LSIDVALNRELMKLIRERLDTGRYHSPSEVLREGLLVLSERDRWLELRREGLHREIARGVASAQAGRVVDGPKALVRLRARAKRLEKRRKRA
jgi:antitoxin ParD1/3/4